MNAIWATCLISLLLSLINIGSHKALENILSFTVSSWEAAASIPLGLLLWSRMTGRIRSAPDTFDGYQNDSSKILTWGPWHVTEPLGTYINAFGLGWIILAFFFSFWPGKVDVRPETMNYSSLMTGFWFVFGMVYYMAHGRKHYTGPRVDI